MMDSGDEKMMLLIETLTSYMIKKVGPPTSLLSKKLRSFLWISPPVYTALDFVSCSKLAVDSARQGTCSESSITALTA